MKLVRIVKWCLLFISACWAIYAGVFFMFLARAFPSLGPIQYGTEDFLASAQGYLVVFGPLLFSAIFLMMKWPERRKKNSN